MPIQDLLFTEEKSRRRQCEPGYQDQVGDLNRAHAHPQPSKLVRDLLSDQIGLVDVILDVSTIQNMGIVIDERVGPFPRARLYHLRRKEERTRQARLPAKR